MIIPVTLTLLRSMMKSEDAADILALTLSTSHSHSEPPAASTAAAEPGCLLCGATLQSEGKEVVVVVVGGGGGGTTSGERVGERQRVFIIVTAQRCCLCHEKLKTPCRPLKFSGSVLRLPAGRLGIKGDRKGTYFIFCSL